MTADKFRTLSQFKCLRAIAEPGEPVGLLAAQVRGRREGGEREKQSIEEKVAKA